MVELCVFLSKLVLAQLRVVLSPALAKLDVSLSVCRAEDTCVEALAKPDKLWTALGALRVEFQPVNSLEKFRAQLLRS